MEKDYNFSYDNLEVEFSPDGTQIKADGHFFKGGFMTHAEVMDYVLDLSNLQKLDNFHSELSRKSNAYFLGLMNKLDELFHVKALIKT